MSTVFLFCRHVVTCDDRQAVLTTVMIFLTTGSFSCVCQFLNFENRPIIEGDMAMCDSRVARLQPFFESQKLPKYRLQKNQGTETLVKVTFHDVKATPYKVKVTPYNVKVTSHNVKVTKQYQGHTLQCQGHTLHFQGHLPLHSRRHGRVFLTVVCVAFRYHFALPWCVAEP